MDHGPNALLPSLRRALLAPAVGLVLFAGCETAGRRDPNDVLFGGTPAAPSPIPPPGRPVNAVAGAPAATTKPLPPLPPPGPSSTLATLASGNNATAENDRASRPAGVTPVPDGGWRGGATLHGPQPVDESGNRITPVGATGSAVGVAPVGGIAQDSYQQVMEKLKARGMTWNRLETTGENGSWKFSCTVVDRNNPGIEQRYEASAPGEFGLAAMRAVLDKIEHPEQ
jgi:hypothetical protein